MSPEIFETRLMSTQYVADQSLVRMLQAFYQLHTPLIVEGGSGVGKTSLADVIAQSLSCSLVRLPCFEGVSFSRMCYEWDISSQLLALKMFENQNVKPESVEHILYSPKFLIKKPILQSISQTKPCVLLIDDIDRADEAFESELLTWMLDFTVNIPQLGRMPVATKPFVIITHNKSRFLSEPLRQYCLYCHLEFPHLDKALRIVKKHYPTINDMLAKQIVLFVQYLRRQPLQKQPGMSELLSWTRCLLLQEMTRIDGESERVQHSLGCLLKSFEDMQIVANDHINIDINSELQ